jgi:hypothetical protein
MNMGEKFTILSSNHESYAINGLIEFRYKATLFDTKDLITLIFQDKNKWLKMRNFSYSFSEVTNFKEVDEEISEINKTAAGTVGGAILGTVVAGPFGALVGGMAGGNKKKDKKESSTFAIEFNNKEWVMFKLKNNLSNRIHIKDFKLHFSQFFAEEKKQENPFQ